MRKKISLYAVLVLALVVFGRVSGGEKPLKIGLCMSSLDTFLSTLADSAINRAREKGYELIVMDAQDDTVKQSDQVNNLLTDGVDALIVCVVETSSAPPIVEVAAAAGVPIVWVNRNPFFTSGVIPPNNYVLSANSFLEGATGMEFAGERMGGKGNIVILMGMLGHEATFKRSEGVRSVIREKYPDIKILDEQTGNWFRDQGMTVMENLITAHGDRINAVLSNNDEMALGAVLALRQNGMNDVLVVGVDGTADGIASVAQGDGINATAYQDPVAQGSGSVDLVERILRGENPDQHTQLEVELITRDNYRKFMK